MFHNVASAALSIEKGFAVRWAGVVIVRRFCVL